MLRRSSICGNTLLVRCAWCAILVAIIISAGAVSVNAEVVKREERRTLVSTEYGEISAARVSDNINASYLLHFFTLELNSLLLPLILHSDMVFYVHTGKIKINSDSILQQSVFSNCVCMCVCVREWKVKLDRGRRSEERGVKARRCLQSRRGSSVLRREQSRNRATKAEN